ncbi:MAG: response regulator [Enterococcus sp.]|nr:response regulator [Enterococcus sp.]
MKLLIVEDEIKLCESIANGLKISGYEVDTCHDGLEASALLEIEEYDLVILDLNLPGMDGMEILKNFRIINKNTNVLILSANPFISLANGNGMFSISKHNCPLSATYSS